MRYTIPAKPTTVNGVEFRSRLEARWGMFFDLHSLSWIFEPYDLDGWFPDFLLQGELSALVEIKPYSAPYSDTVSPDVARTMLKNGAAMEKAKLTLPVLLLGAGPDGDLVGWIRTVCPKRFNTPSGSPSAVITESIGELELWKPCLWTTRGFLSLKMFSSECDCFIESKFRHRRHRNTYLPYNEEFKKHYTSDEQLLWDWNRCLPQWTKK